jgi:hypothetical protein
MLETGISFSQKKKKTGISGRKEYYRPSTTKQHWLDDANESLCTGAVNMQLKRKMSIKYTRDLAPPDM